MNSILLIVASWPPTFVQHVRLPYVLQVKADCFFRDLEVFGKFTTGLPAVLLYGCFQSRLIILRVTGPCGVHHKGTDLPTWTSGTNAFTRSIVPNGFRYSATWCGWGHDHLKVIKQTTSNELFRQRHVSSPLLELWMMCVRNAPVLVKRNAAADFPVRVAFIRVSVMTSFFFAYLIIRDE